jgi:heme-degrading monooxygenase HmoA
MTIMRVAEFTVNPGKGPQVMAAAREMQELASIDGGNIAFYQLIGGGTPGTMFATTVLDDLESFGALSDAVNNNPKWAEWMAHQSELPGFPFSTGVEVSVLQDLHAEVGEPSDLIENPGIVVVYRQLLAPGKRDAFIAMAKTVRAMLKKEDRPVGMTMQSLFGNTSVITRSLGYESVAAWSAAQNAGWPAAVIDVLKNAQADGPMFESVECLLVRDVTPA